MHAPGGGTSPPRRARPPRAAAPARALRIAGVCASECALKRTRASLQQGVDPAVRVRRPPGPGRRTRTATRPCVCSTHDDRRSRAGPVLIAHAVRTTGTPTGRRLQQKQAGPGPPTAGGMTLCASLRDWTQRHCVITRNGRTRPARKCIGCAEHRNSHSNDIVSDARQDSGSHARDIKAFSENVMH